MPVRRTVRCERCGRYFRAVDENYVREYEDLCWECIKSENYGTPLLNFNWKMILAAVGCMFFWWLLYKFLT